MAARNDAGLGLESVFLFLFHSVGGARGEWRLRGTEATGVFSIKTDFE